MGHGHNLGIRSLTEPTEYAEKNKKLCDLFGLCEITRKCLQLSKFLMAEIRTNSQKAYEAFMNKAFVKEDDSRIDTEPEFHLDARADIPAGARNYMTPKGARL